MLTNYSDKAIFNRSIGVAFSLQDGRIDKTIQTESTYPTKSILYSKELRQRYSSILEEIPLSTGGFDIGGLVLKQPVSPEVNSWKLFKEFPGIYDILKENTSGLYYTKYDTDLDKLVKVIDYISPEGTNLFYNQVMVPGYSRDGKEHVIMNANEFKIWYRTEREFSYGKSKN